jgi:hypothetical protein
MFYYLHMSIIIILIVFVRDINIACVNLIIGLLARSLCSKKHYSLRMLISFVTINKMLLKLV